MTGTGKFNKRPSSQLNALDRKQKSSQLSAMHCQTEAHIIACTSPSIMNLDWNMSDSISQGQQNDKSFQVMAHGTRIANDISGHFNTEKIRHCHLRAWFYARQKAIFPFIEGRSKELCQSWHEKTAHSASCLGSGLSSMYAKERQNCIHG
jgi:hypothetical protein